MQPYNRISSDMFNKTNYEYKIYQSKNMLMVSRIKFINNILLYAFEEQNAVGYWIKIGGEIIFEEDGVIFFNLKRENLKSFLH